MITLSWKPILSNLSEAYGELKGLYCRLHFMAFGEMPDNWQDDGSYKAWLEKREKELSNIKGENLDINFGSQIRTYTLHPYSLVKDHRTNTENINPIKVLDGDIDLFINECLKRDVK